MKSTPSRKLMCEFLKTLNQISSYIVWGKKLGLRRPFQGRSPSPEIGNSWAVGKGLYQLGFFIANDLLKFDVGYSY